MRTLQFVYWQNDDAFLGHLVDFPDYWTQGESLEDLKAHLADLYKDLASGVVSQDGCEPRRKSCIGRWFHRLANSRPIRRNLLGGKWIATGPQSSRDATASGEIPQIRRLGELVVS